MSSLGPNGAEWELSDTLRMAIEHAAANGREGQGCAIFWASSNGRNVDIAKDEVVSHPDVIAVGRWTLRDQEDNSARGAKLGGATDITVSAAAAQHGVLVQHNRGKTP